MEKQFVSSLFSIVSFLCLFGGLLQYLPFGTRCFCSIEERCQRREVDGGGGGEGGFPQQFIPATYGTFIHVHPFIIVHPLRKEERVDLFFSISCE